MSFTWRYVLHDDGTLSRIMQLPGTHLSDDYLAALHTSSTPPPPIPPCSRCGAALALGWHGPFVSGVWMELCPRCDSDKPAARAFLRWLRNPDRTVDPLQRLFEDWETETMREHGWARTEPVSLPDNVTPIRRVTPRGQG